MENRVLRADRVLSTRGGYGVDIRLPNMRNTPAVFWSVGGNSFVVLDNGVHGLVLASVNGIGEIRWFVETWNRDAESNAARDYFFVNGGL